MRADRRAMAARASFLLRTRSVVQMGKSCVGDTNGAYKLSAHMWSAGRGKRLTADQLTLQLAPRPHSHLGRAHLDPGLSHRRPLRIEAPPVDESLWSPETVTETVPDLAAH